MIPYLEDELLDLIAQQQNEEKLEQEFNELTAEYNTIMKAYYTVLSEMQYFTEEQLIELRLTATKALMRPIP